MSRDTISNDHEYDDDLDDSECWNCGGEGRVNTCIDGCCLDQDDIYCKYCSRRCDVCNAKPKQEKTNVAAAGSEGTSEAPDAGGPPRKEGR
jgi:hypothetical protein